MCVYTGKAFSYFASQESWIREVFYHPISDASTACLLRTACTPSQRVGHISHKLWVCFHKQSGTVLRAYCTCMAGCVHINSVCVFLVLITVAQQFILCIPTTVLAARNVDKTAVQDFDV